MAKKVPLSSIGVSRDGKTVYPEIGKAFDFTDAEIKELEALQAKTGDEFIRDPVNEDAPAAAPAAEEKPTTKKGDKPAAPAAADL